MSGMQVVQLGLFVDPRERPPDQLIDEWYGSTAVADSVASVGTSVTVILANRIPGRIERSGIVYDFIAPESSEQRVTLSSRFKERMHEIAPDIVHVHGLGFPKEVIDIAASFPGLPILLQDHASRPPRIWRRRLWRRAAEAVAGISFSARAQAEPFRRAGLLRQGMQIFEIPESTSWFMPGDQAAARSATGMSGDPAVLCVAHLNDNKDPLTVLDGVSRAVGRLPGLQLWWCFASAPRLAAVQARIDSDDNLRGRVHLLGRVPHSDIEQWMQAADLFVLGSHREGCNFSLIEALATGLLPVVTDIPSNRMLTGDGHIGELWTKGESQTLASALITAAERGGEHVRAPVLAHYRQHLSAEALGRRFTKAYAQLIQAGSPGQPALRQFPQA